MFNWLKSAFSDNGTPSSSRLLTAVHSVSSAFVLIYIGIRTRTYPSAAEGSALGGFATVHYLVNRVTTAWGKDKPQDGDK